MKLILTAFVLALPWGTHILTAEITPAVPVRPAAISNQTDRAAEPLLTNRTDAVLQNVIALGSKPGDESYDTNRTDEVLKQVIAMGGKVKQDNRWILTRVLNLREKDLIFGLSAFVKYSKGRYPTSLIGKTMSEELIKLTDRSPSAGGIRESEDRFKKEFVNALCASGFYEKLIREKRDPKYFGDKVTVFDASRVLVRWKLKKDRYRVIYTDLHAEDVTTLRLVELETQGALPKTSTNQPPPNPSSN